MSALFEAASEGTPDLEQIDRALKRKIERRDRITESLGKEGTVEAVARNDLKRLDREISRLRERREKLKERLLKEISTAVDRVAKREKLDFVLNMGEGCIYGRDRYDVTEKVLREMVRLKQRSAPVSR
jgi:Skp family chaperone for outer membrane proteins